MTTLTREQIEQTRVAGWTGVQDRNWILESLCDLALRGLENSAAQDVAAPSSAVSTVMEAVGQRSDDKPATAGGRDAKQAPVSAEPDLAEELRSMLNRYSAENNSNTPDFILAQFLRHCLLGFDTATQQRETWYGRDARPAEQNSAAQAQQVTGQPETAPPTPASAEPNAAGQERNRRDGVEAKPSAVSVGLSADDKSRSGHHAATEQGGNPHPAPAAPSSPPLVRERKGNR